jgi:AP2 domain
MRAAPQSSRRRTINPDLPRFVYPNGNGYRALIRSGYKILYLGTFDTPEAASAAAERMARELRGKLYVRAKPTNATGAKGKAAKKRGQRKAKAAKGGR